ncbi:MAG TPA: hypothetical protein PKO23_20125, partial [Candidatus Hydrogenedentes bacterium]|nr:hypothetical protein [Candidatus Hydrogenedentota bacterium]
PEDVVVEPCPVSGAAEDLQTLATPAGKSAQVLSVTGGLSSLPWRGARCGFITPGLESVCA